MANSKRNIFITAFDKSRLEELIAVATEFGDQKREDLESLVGALSQAKVVEPKKIPADTVTMNPKVKLRDRETDEFMTCMLLFPQDVEFEDSEISILAPGAPRSSATAWAISSTGPSLPGPGDCRSRISPISPKLRTTSFYSRMRLTEGEHLGTIA